MHYFVTTCSKEKEIHAALLPALKRYTNARITQVYQRSLQQNAGFIILSGKFGLLLPHQPIPWYDEALTALKLPDLLPIITKQLQHWQPAGITFFAKNHLVFPDWEPYYHAIYMPCTQLNIPFEHRLI